MGSLYRTLFLDMTNLLFHLRSAYVSHVRYYIYIDEASDFQNWESSTEVGSRNRRLLYGYGWRASSEVVLVEGAKFYFRGVEDIKGRTK